MADTKIASLTDGLTTSGTDRIPVAISPYGSGNNAYITPSYLKTFMVTGGTVTSSTPVFDMTQTWNSGVVTFSGLKLNVTDTASASGSLLMDLQVGGSSKGSLSKAGNAVLAGTVALGGSPTATLFKQSVTDYIEAGTGFSMGAGSSNGVSMNTGFFNAGPISYYGFNGSNGIGAPDLKLWRDAANVLALQNGTNAQTFNIYNTSTSSNANYERIALFFSSNLARLAVQRGGTGVDRDLLFYVGSQDTWKISASTGSFLAAKDNTFDIGEHGANRPRNLYVTGTIQGKLTTDTAYTATPPTCTGYVTIYDSTGTPYKVMVST